MHDEPVNSRTAAVFTEPARTPPAAPLARYAWVPWSLVLVLCGTMLWFAARDGASRRPAGPQFEEWKDGELAAELFGLESEVAVRWTGGFLTGWVEFDDQERQPISFPVLDTGNTSPESISGQLIVCRHPSRPPGDHDDVSVFLRAEWLARQDQDGSIVQRSLSGSFRGALNVHRKPETTEAGITLWPPRERRSKVASARRVVLSVMKGSFDDAEDAEDAEPLTWFDVGISPVRREE